MRNTQCIVMLTALLTGSAAMAFGSYDQEAGPRISRDRSYEQILRYEASADNAVTPARVLRWMRASLLGIRTDSQKESNVEFRPVVKANESNGYRILASVVYKF
jgi:hypothetical protein